MENPSILVIDDEPDNFDVIEAFLSTRNCQLHYASTGQEAIASLNAFQPDLILLDVMMPGMDGIEVCRQIKAMPQWRSVPIMMVTALAAKESLARCLESGADDFISKPVNPLELRARVDSMLRIKSQYDDLQTLLKLRQDMVNMMVHDLRTPLGNILLGLELLKVLQSSPNEQKATIGQIQIAGTQLQTLIDELLLVAKIESGKLCMNPTDVDLSALIPSVLDGFKVMAEKKGLDLVSKVPDSNSTVYVDAAMFRRVLDNLLSNAIKFSPERSQVVVYVNYLDPGGAQIQFVDQGPGVSDAVQEKVFEKYEIGTPIKDVSQTGLGLAFCKLVVEAHDGQISVRNNKPTGSIFEIMLPQ